ncbi:L-rhamnose mutarotase [Pararhodonellum marinum]|uniref:L-rhamnose mutarotase n=1 Tax=Pararhodonellum marinum TaxID=2755358 RepID=UPI001890AE51|nr:L-rhamnose mutarotase [Pararhodonellum marinum]
MKTNRYCLTLDLKNDPLAISAYEQYHEKVWPEILQSIEAAGITSMHIYRWETRLFMIMETLPEFSFEKKAKLDASNAKVQEWEKLLWQYQKSLPGSKPGEKWQLMKHIFEYET